MQQQFSAREVELILPTNRESLRERAKQLPVTRASAKGKRTTYTLKDLAVFWIAQKLSERGLTTPVAIDMAVSAEKHFIQVMVDDESGTRWWMTCALQPDKMGRYDVAITSNTVEALTVVEHHPGAAVISLTDLLKELFARILAHEEAKNAKR
ncbi:hypothetical protein B7H23_12910 [Notoacmeibacter marinus]|uniref:Uncharacterized protein n=1 Tax=Notoacmeibacter marinus TaxID=1876515 RepID=A0A231UT68_9HYPH|nr:hypothetical protein [Notoacmeibacter marinus]OXS99099.1 hypothetical protein B7H23_12910 [Notoacmeibacter marinus]